MKEIRNNFVNSFNEKINKEQILYNELINAFDINNLENYCNTYRDLIKLNVKISSTIQEIKSILSLKKDQFISNAIQKSEIKTKIQAMNFYNDITMNNWIISDDTFNKLINLANNLQ
jgi:hypothetical protein